MSFILSSGFIGSHRYSSLCGLRAKMGSLSTILCQSEIPKTRSLLRLPIHEHIQKPTRTSIYIYIYIYTHTWMLIIIPYFSLPYFCHLFAINYTKIYKNTDVTLSVQCVTLFKRSPHCSFDQSTTEGGCSTQLQDKQQCAGMECSITPKINPKEGFWPLPTDQSKRTLNLPSSFLFESWVHYDLYG